MIAPRIRWWCQGHVRRRSSCIRSCVRGVAKLFAKHMKDVEQAGNCVNRQVAVGTPPPAPPLRSRCPET